MTKRVESLRVPCLDAGSTPATSTKWDFLTAFESFERCFSLDAGYLGVLPRTACGDCGTPSMTSPAIGRPRFDSRHLHEVENKKRSAQTERFYFSKFTIQNCV